MAGSNTRLYGLKYKLTLMMAFLLAACLSLLYILNQQAEAHLMTVAEETLLRIEEKVNDCVNDIETRSIQADPQLARGSRRSKSPFVVWDPEFWDPGASLVRQSGRGFRDMLREMTLAQERLLEIVRDQTRAFEVPHLRLKIYRAGPTSGKASVRTVRLGGLGTSIGHPADRPVSGARRTEKAESEPTPSETLEAEILVDLEPLRASVASIRVRNILIVLGVFLMGIIVSWLLATGFTSPIQQMKLAFGRVAAGDLEETPLPPRRDEIGEMGESFRVMVRRLRENRDLEKKMFEQERFSTIGHLAAGVAHEIRNPLNAIGLTIDHMQDEFRPEDLEKRESFLRFTAAIRGEIARLNNLVTNFLSLSRPPSLDVRPHDLNEIVRGLLDLVRQEAETRGVEITADLDPSLPSIPLDDERIRAAVMNLILNALQAIDPGEGGQIVIRTGKVGREAHLVVEDSGRGIPPEEMERVFLPYFTTREEGTGLGLTVSRVTIESHGGRIDIVSHPGEGTAVSVVLPIEGPAGKT